MVETRRLEKVGAFRIQSATNVAILSDIGPTRMLETSQPRSPTADVYAQEGEFMCLSDAWANTHPVLISAACIVFRRSQTGTYVNSDPEHDCQR
jgi:hypothetical protein